MVKKEAKKIEEKAYALWIAVIVFIAVLGIFMIWNFSGGNKEEKSEVSKEIYKIYRQVCNKDISYFENLSLSAYNSTEENFIMRIKANSSECFSVDMSGIEKDSLQDFGCKCIDWDGKKSCPEGYELSGNLCINEADESFTNCLISCSRYLCKDGFIAEISETMKDL